MKRWISVALVAIISTVIYSNSLDGDFVFDDHRAILTNDDLDTEKTSVWELFMHDFWGGTMWRKESHKSYRPLTVLTYRYFNHSFTGLNPFSYHLVNVILHGLTCILFLYVAEVVLQTQSEWPLFAALLFSTHSIHVESVSSHNIEPLWSIHCILRPDRHTLILYPHICYSISIESQCL